MLSIACIDSLRVLRSAAVLVCVCAAAHEFCVFLSAPEHSSLGLLSGFVLLSKRAKLSQNCKRSKTSWPEWPENEKKKEALCPTPRMRRRKKHPAVLLVCTAASFGHEKPTKESQATSTREMDP